MGMRAFDLRPSRANPVGPLPPERHPQNPADRNVVRRPVCGNTHDDRLLRNREQNCPVEVVPGREKAGPVAVGFIAPVGVVDAMHARGDDESDEESLESQWQSRVRVVKQDRDDQERMIDPDRDRRRSDDDHLQDPPSDREGVLSKVEPKRRGGVHVAVDVVHEMEPPKEWNQMVDPVPVPQRVVQEQDSHSYFDGGGQIHEIQQPDPVPFRPADERHEDWGLKESDDGEAECSGREVAERPSETRLDTASQRAHSLQRGHRGKDCRQSDGANPERRKVTQERSSMSPAPGFGNDSGVVDGINPA